MADEYTVEDYRAAARRALDAGNVQAAEELAQAGIALQRNAQGTRPQPRPRQLAQPDPRVTEREQMRANALPPGTNPDTIPQPSRGIDPATMPALSVPAGRPVPDGTDVIAVTEDGGYVMRGADGALSYAGSEMSTTDQGRVMEVLRGATPAAAYRQGYSQDIADQNPVASRAAVFTQGAPFLGSYTDEIAGAAVGIGEGLWNLDIQRGIDAGRETSQNVLAATNAMEEGYPGQTAALRTAGTVAYSVPAVLAGAPGAPRETTRLAQGLRNTGWGMGLGGLEGFIYGLGDQEGEGRLVNATRQGLTGLALGGAAGAMVSALDRRILGQAQRLRGQSVNTIQEQLGVSREAAQMVREALEGGELSRAVATLQQRGPEAMLAEASPALRQLLNVMTKTDVAAGNIAARAIEPEMSRRYGNLVSTLNETLGNPQGVQFAEASLMEGTRATRSAAYNEAFETPIDYASEAGTRLQEDVLARIPANVVRQANEAMRMAGTESDQIMARIADDGTVTFERPPSVEQLDFMARRLQGLESAARRAGDTDQAQRYGNLRREIRGTLRQLVPRYGDALDEASDVISQREALDLGYRMLRMRPSEVRFEVRGASANERTMMRVGIREEIEDRMAQAGEVASDRNMDAREIRAIMRDVTGRGAREKFRAIMGADEADRLVRSIETAMDGLELRAAIARNSDTAIAQATQRRMGELVAPDLLEAASNMRVGEARDAIVTSLAGDSMEAQQLRMSGLAREISSLLTSQTGEGAQRALRIINQYIDNPQAMPDRDAQFVARMVTRAGALTAYLQGQNALMRQ